MTPGAAIGIDLGGTNLKAALVAPSGSILAQAARPTDTAHGPQQVLRDMVSLVRALCHDCDIDVAALAGVGVGSPGPLSPSRGLIIRAPNLPGWVNVPLRDRLADILQTRVVVDNDGNAAALGEWWAGVGEKRDDLVMLTLGTGIGGGVILEGRILHGHHENAGELGHMIVVPDGLPCACGKRGCLERYASASCLTARVREAIENGEPSLLAEVVASDRTLDARQVIGAAREGDALCERLWNESCRYLAVACINIQHAFNPRYVVLGGGLAEAGDCLIDRVQHHVTRMQWTLHDDAPTISRGALGYDAGVIGAAALVWLRA